jgi:hypothetical protein
VSTGELDEDSMPVAATRVKSVMNSTYIHLRVRDPNIYMYRRGEYTKNPLEKYNNRKG